MKEQARHALERLRIDALGRLRLEALTGADATRTMVDVIMADVAIVRAAITQNCACKPMYPCPEHSDQTADEAWQARMDAIAEIIVQEFPSAEGFYGHATDAALKIMKLLDDEDRARRALDGWGYL